MKNNKQQIREELSGRVPHEIMGLLIWDDAPNRHPLLRKDKVRLKKHIKLLKEYCKGWRLHYLTGKIYQRLEQHRKAFDEFQRSISECQDNHILYAEASIEAACLKDWDVALKVIDTALAINYSAENLVNKALILLYIGNKDSALELAAKAVTFHPDSLHVNMVFQKISNCIAGNVSLPANPLEF